MSDIIIGIDPGIYGAIAVLDNGTWQVHDLPRIEYTKNRYELDLIQFGHLMGGIIGFPSRLSDEPLIVIEQPPIVPGNGVLAYRSLFKNWGEIRGFIYALIGHDKLFVLQPQPQLWKKSVLEGTKKDKEAAIKFVQQHYPQITIPPHPKPKKKGDLHDGIADAVCLAVYGYKHLQSIPQTHK